MAKPSLALEENVEGNFYVDSTCIDCAACRRFAASVFGATGEYSVVSAQPTTENDTLAAQRALLACPTASIGTHEKTDLKSARNSFPLELVPGVFINGYNARESFGGDSYFLEHPDGNWLVDSPRFTQDLMKAFEAKGGIKYIFLSHRDDVAEAHLFARHFGAQRMIHELDSDVQKDAEIIVQGEDDLDVGPGKIIFTPGHTRGHQVLLWEDKYLFTGDHLCWRPNANRFGSFREACWYSWDVQIESVDKLKQYPNVEWVFPAHGHNGKVEGQPFADQIERAVRWMKSVR